MGLDNLLMGMRGIRNKMGSSRMCAGYNLQSSPLFYLRTSCQNKGQGLEYQSHPVHWVGSVLGERPIAVGARVHGEIYAGMAWFLRTLISLSILSRQLA